MESASTTNWRQLVVPNEPHKLKRRLDWDGLNEEGFGAWLAFDWSKSDSEAFASKAALDEACDVLKACWNISLLPYDNKSTRPFVDLWWPVRCHFSEKLKCEQSLVSSSNFIANKAFDDLADALLDRLCYIGDKPLWEVFSKGRTAGAMLLAHLDASGDGSDTPVREHYEKFIQVHRRNGLALLLEEFPVLGRHLGTLLRLCYRNSVEILKRIGADRDILAGHFGIPESHDLIGIRQNLSDPHNGCRAVAVLQFAETDASKNPLHLVYKPKDMRVDATFQALLDDLNCNSGLEPLQTIDVHASNGYGYMEFVPHRICADDKELERFYNNAGRLTAVLHLLGCTDCHHENLIACGDQLLLIDTETILEVDLPDHISQAAIKQSSRNTKSAFQNKFQRSVLRSGLLPHCLFVGIAKEPRDVSALGISPSSSTKRPLGGWLGINSDGMMPGRVAREIDTPTSLPVGVGAENPFNQFLDIFCSGFKSQMHELLAMQDRWLSSSSALSDFKGLPRRIVLRATRVYFLIQRKQLEASALRSPLAQNLQLEQLSRSYLLAENRPLTWPVFAAEVRQMQQLDIPFFTHLIDGNVLKLDENGEELKGFTNTSGLEAARERLRLLDDDEISFQLRVIRGVTEAKQLGTTAEESPNAGAALAEASKNLPQENSFFRSQAAAKCIADQLLKLAIHDPQGHVEWLGMDLGADGESFGFGPVGHSLYGGSMGIACFLNRLQKLQITLRNGEEIQAAILRPLQVLIHESNDDDRRRWWRDQPLGLHGCGGILLGLEQLDQQDLVDGFLAATLPQYLQADQKLDLIGGCAGLIGPLLHKGTPTSLELAIKAGDQLIDKQEEQGGWLSSPHQLALLGFSHGTAGFAAALARLHSVTGEERFRIGAAKALAYERVHFSKADGNWPDYRKINSGLDQTQFILGWCHGAPGIALGRACLWGTALWDEQCADEIAISLETISNARLHSFDHLCCGNLGVMLIQQILCSGPWPIAEDLRRRCIQSAEAIKQEALERCLTHSMRLRCYTWRDGNLLLPGFFTGMSGMGMALLDDPQSSTMNQQLLSAGLLSS